MRRVKLKDVAEITGGSTPKTKVEEYWNGDIVWLSPTDLPDIGEITTISDSARKITEEGLNSCSAKLLPVGAVIFSSRASIGKIGINEVPVATNQGFINFICGEDIYNRYLTYTLKYFTEDIVQLSNSTTFKEVSRTAVKNFEIPLPSLSEQKAIVAKLDRAQRLIDIDREMLAKYDELIQSVFLEMFGDVFSDKTKTPFEDHLEIKHGYAFKSKWFDEEGDVPVVKIGTVNKSNVDFSEVQFLDYSYAEEYERFKVFPGDLLLSMTGTVGKDDYANPCIMTDDYDFYLLNQRVVKLNYDEKVFTKSFLYHFFKQDHVKRELTKFSRGIRQANLSNKDIYGLSFQKPDFDKQLQFEVLCDKVEKEKKLLKTSTKKSEELFSSLVQGVFG